MSDSPKFETPRPKVEHAKLRCTCAACIAERQAEVRRRLEEQRRDARREAMAMLEDTRGRGIVFARRPQPGTQKAIAARYGKRAS